MEIIVYVSRIADSQDTSDSSLKEILKIIREQYENFLISLKDHNITFEFSLNVFTESIEFNDK